MSKHSIIWWNVERLFHYEPSTLRISVAGDEAWSEETYWKKIHAVGNVLGALADKPAIVGLAEVQNSRVVADLLESAGWSHLLEVEQGPTVFPLDGYDVAILYDPDVLQMVGKAAAHSVHRYATRDVLEAVFQVPSGEEFLIQAHHWPSRLISTSDGLRLGLAEYTARLMTRWLKLPLEALIVNGEPVPPTREIAAQHWNKPALLIGDFNDEPFDKSIRNTLRSTQDPRTSRTSVRLSADPWRAVHNYLTARPRLFNPSWSLFGRPDGPKGTMFWNGHWYLVDQVLMSRGLLDGPAVKYAADSLQIAVPGSEQLTRSGRPKKFDADSGRGVSDHLPLVLQIEFA